MLLDCVEVCFNPNNLPITYSVIWLHGLGADGHDFEPIVPELGLSGEQGVRFIFPHAPSMPVTINQGYVMPAWYDILEMNIERKVDIEQIKISVNRIYDLIAREVNRGVATNHIVIAGFSQGGAVAYHTALSYDKPLAGLLTLSTYIATKDILQINPIHTQLPIFICHGTFDPVVPQVLGDKATEWLNAKGCQVIYQTYPMAHQVCQPQIKAIGEWLNHIFQG